MDEVAAADSIVDSIICVVADADSISVVGTAVVVSSVDRVAVIVWNRSVVVTLPSSVVSALLSALEGRQGPADTAPRTMGNRKAVNRILVDQVAFNSC